MNRQTRLKNMKNLLTARTKTRAGRPGKLLVAATLLLCLCSGPTGQCAEKVGASIAAAEKSLFEGRFNTALEQYRNLLNSLLSEKTPLKEKKKWMPEVDLALRRVININQRLQLSAETGPLLATWARKLSEIEPTVSALASFGAGWLALDASGSTAEAQRHWRDLGQLSRWSIIGPFDNERGTGFLTGYEPEKGIDFEKPAMGKVRELSWRELPRQPLAGYVDFNEMMRPADEALAYAVTFISSDSDQDLSLRLGSDESYRVWLNGELLGSEDLEREYFFDQTILDLPLKKGWNCLLLKVGESEGKWGFSARITAASGKAAGGWQEGRPGPQELAGFRELQAQEELAEPDRPTTSALGPIAELRKRIAADPLLLERAARRHYLLGTLLYLQGAHDSDEHPDTELLRKAIQIDSKPSQYHYQLASSYYSDTTVAAQRDDNNWRDAMLAAEERGAALASIKLAEYYLDTFSNIELCRRHLARARKINPDLLNIVTIESRLEEKLGFPDRSRREIKKFAAIDPDSSAALRARAALLARLGKHKEESRILQELLKRSHLNQGIRLRLAGSLLNGGDHEAASSLLQEGALLAPFSIGPLLRLARIEQGRDKHSAAASIYLTALEIQPEEHTLLESLGRAYWEIGRKERAFAAWDRALELQPNLPELRKRIEFLRSEEKPFEDEFRRDGSRLAAAAHAENYKSESGEAARILLELTALEVNKDGTSREFSQTLVQVLNDRGIQMFDRFSETFSQGEQVLEFKLARVHHPDGTSEDAKLPRFGRRASATQSWRRGSVDLPPLSAGDIIEVQSIKEDIQQSFFGDYFGRREIFRNTLATAEKVFKLRVPAGREFYFHQRNMNTAPSLQTNPEDDVKTYTWTAKGIPKVDSEPGMPWAKEVMPLLEISTFENWESFNKWYSNLIRKQFESSPELDRKVAELVSGKDTEIEKIRALYNFVVTDIRYNAWEFGVHGFKPYNASKVFARRFGDCKDKATLLCVMLEKVNIKAHPVLIFANRSRGKEDLSLPMVNHFNHCITYLPPAGNRPELYLDGTASFHSVEELPSMDRGAQVLIVRDEGELVQQIPWNSPGDLSVDEEWDIKLADNGSAEITIGLKAKGDFAVFLRRNFELEAQRKTLLEKTLGRKFAGAQVVSQEFSNLSNLDENVTMEIRFTAPSFANSSAAEITFSLVDDFFGSVGNLGVLGALEKRENDVVLGNPRRSRLKATYRLPAGIELKSTPENRDIDTRFGRFRLSTDSSSPGAIVFERLFEMKKNRVPLSQYQEFRKLAASVDQLSNEKTVLRKTGS